MDNFAAWMINGGRDPMERLDDRDLLHRRALREARSTATRTSLVGRLSASIRSTFRSETTRSDALCCTA